MCLIATSDAKRKIPLELLSNAYDNNKDGVGIVFYNKITERLQIIKSAGNFEDFKKIWEICPDDVNIAVHFRFKTHGDLSVDNIHPYEILSKDKGHSVDMVMMHNGTIGSIHTSGDKRSDTAMYIDLILRPILAENPTLIYNEGFLKLVTRDIGSHNKFLFFDSSDKVTLFNEASGHTDKDVPDVWFSNSYSIKTNTYRSSKTSAGSYYSGFDHRWEGGRYVPATTPSPTTRYASATDTFSCVKLDPMFDDKSEKDAIEELKRFLDADESLLSRTNKINKKPIGYGWVIKGGKAYTYYPNIAAMHEKLDNIRSQLDRKAKSVKVTAVVEPSPITQNKLLFDLEKNLTLRDLNVYTKSETLEWVVNYPARAAELLISKGFGGGKIVVEDYVSKNTDAASEAIFNLAHYGTFETPFGDFFHKGNIAI